MKASYRLRNRALVVQVLAEATDHLELLVDRQTINRGLDDVAHARLVYGNETVVVHERKESHDELAVHTVGNTTVARDRLAKVLDVEGTLQTRGKEPTKGSNERGKSSKPKNVELHGLNPESLVQTKQLQRVGLREENGVQLALKAGQDIRAKVVDGADEVLVPHQDVGHEVSENNGADPGTKETFNGLLRGQLDQLGASKGDTADVGEDIIRNDKRGREEEPDHALEDIVHHKVRLNHDDKQGHVRPSPLSELESVVALLQRSDEENES